MIDVVYSSKFKRDFKRCVKRNFDMMQLQNAIDILRIPKKLSESYKDHPLQGEYSGYSECHIKPDWLLVYKYRDFDGRLLLARTGTHSDIFDM